MIKSENNLSKKKALDFYQKLMLPRQIEEKMLKLLRQGKVSKWFSGIGQEAIAVGATAALSDNDYILPMHRNLGVFTERNVPLYPLVCQLLGKADGFTMGRERSFHFGILEYKIVGMISHLAAMLPVACGLALSSKLAHKKQVALAFCGEGATSEGDFHEALNLAAVWQLPVIFLIENNGYGLSTPSTQQYACNDLVDRAPGYGMEGIPIDGNNVMEVYNTVSKARKSVLRKQGPVLIEATTFRMRGHEEASGTAYVPQELMNAWEKKDPIARLKKLILDQKIAGQEQLDEIDKKVKDSFQDDINRAIKADLPIFDEEKETSSVFAATGKSTGIKNPFDATKKYRFIDALTAALTHEFDQDHSYIMMGQDIAEYGGVFKVTDGFLEKYGEGRIRNTPIIESGILGTALGLALEGYKPVVEMQFADFITCGFNQIVNNIAKSHYRWSPPVNITIRAPHGAGVSAGPFHSQSPEGWFMQHAGLKVVVPATIEDAFSLTISALRDPNPVLIFEHKKLYRGLSGQFTEPVQMEPLGKAKVRKTGEDATIVTYGMGVHWALDIARKYGPEKDISIEVVDMRTLSPLDMETVKSSIKKTGRVLLLQEASETLGPMSEISSQIADSCFEFLDAPVMRCSSLMTPVPTNKALEDGFLASHRLEKELKRLLEY
ncbi:MAG: thiamine pyrophosphate-dependent enzyme [Balneolales bacterium]